MPKHGLFPEYVDTSAFCPECIADATWMVAESLRRITKHPEYEEGFNPYCIKWQLCDGDEEPIYHGYAHFNSLNEIHHLGDVGRRSYFNCSEAGGEYDNWDFTQEDGGPTHTTTAAVECTLTGPADAGRMVAGLLGLWDGEDSPRPFDGEWAVTDVQPDGRTLRFMARAPIRKDSTLPDGIIRDFLYAVVRETCKDYGDEGLIRLARTHVWCPRAA